MVRTLKALICLKKSGVFITTPRDLATYVHFDALYQSLFKCMFDHAFCWCTYLIRFSRKKVSTVKRDAFATFGGPHVLSLVTEVATRCLKAVRRQKFNYHRRARPEVMGGRLTLVDLNSGVGDKCQLGCAAEAFALMHKEVPEKIRSAIRDHNLKQNALAMRDMRLIHCDQNVTPVYYDEHCEKPDDKKNVDDFETHNLFVANGLPRRLSHAPGLWCRTCYGCRWLCDYAQSIFLRCLNIKAAWKLSVY